MSHVAKIELEIKDLDSLRAACQRLGIEFVTDQKTYQWYGAPYKGMELPEGFTIEDLGKCDHAIKVPDAEFEVGVVKRNGKYTLLWDPDSSGGLNKVLGRNAGKLKQAYSVERVRKEAKLKGYHVLETKTEQGIRVTMTM